MLRRTRVLAAVATAVGAAGLTVVSVLAPISALAAGTAGPLAAPALSSAFLADHVDTHGYAYDNAHSGYNPAVPAIGRIAKAWTANLDGVVQASPLVVGKQVIAATEHNTVYGLDRRTGRVLWSRHLGAPVDGSTLPCGNVNPLGITGTPVADPANTHVWVVTTTPTGNSIRHTLVGLNPANGAVYTSTPVDPANQDPRVENQRGALSFAKGRVVIPYGGLDGDCGNYHGYLVSTDTYGRGLIDYRLAPRDGAAGLWQPSGTSTDPNGNLYAVSGNGHRSSGANDGSNAVLKFDPKTLRLLSSFAPSDWVQRNQQDQDLGSAGAALIGSEVFVQGKGSTGYLLNQANLGGVGGQRSTTQGLCSDQFGTAGVHRNAVFAACGDGLRRMNLQPNGTLSGSWRAPSGVVGTPAIGGGAVWSLNPGSGTLYGMDEATGKVLGTVPVGSTVRFATPELSGSLVLVGTRTGVTAISGA